MIRLEGSPNLSEPRLHAVANLSPLGIIALKRGGAEGWYAQPLVSPEGYDVHSDYGSDAYLENVRQRDLRTIHALRTSDDVFEALKNEPRAAMYKDGRQESVYQHTKRLVEICLEDAGKRPDLKGSLALIADEGWTHDWPEAASGDTVITDSRRMPTKFWGEEAGMTRFRHQLPADDPYLRAAIQYRHPETPEQLLTALFLNAQDKNAAYDFQLRDDVRAELHRERQEDYRKIVFGVIPKVIVDRSALVRTIDTVVRLGYQWKEWGCKPFDGDPLEIVSSALQRAMRLQTAGQPNVYRLPSGGSVPKLGSPMTRKELESRGVTHLDSRRDRNNGTLPPAPTAAMAVAS
jgi:hypothetical protein